MIYHIKKNKGLNHLCLFYFFLQQPMTLVAIIIEFHNIRKQINVMLFTAPPFSIAFFKYIIYTANKLSLCQKVTKFGY